MGSRSTLSRSEAPANICSVHSFLIKARVPVPQRLHAMTCLTSQPRGPSELFLDTRIHKMSAMISTFRMSVPFSATLVTPNRSIKRPVAQSIEQTTKPSSPVPLDTTPTQHLPEARVRSGKALICLARVRFSLASHSLLLARKQTPRCAALTHCCCGPVFCRGRLRYICSRRLDLETTTDVCRAGLVDSMQEGIRGRVFSPLC